MTASASATAASPNFKICSLIGSYIACSCKKDEHVPKCIYYKLDQRAPHYDGEVIKYDPETGLQQEWTALLSFSGKPPKKWYVCVKDKSYYTLVNNVYERHPPLRAGAPVNEEYEGILKWVAVMKGCAEVFKECDAVLKECDAVVTK